MINRTVKDAGVKQMGRSVWVNNVVRYAKAVGGHGVRPQDILVPVCMKQRHAW